MGESRCALILGILIRQVQKR